MNNVISLEQHPKFKRKVNNQYNDWAVYDEFQPVLTNYQYPATSVDLSEGAETPDYLLIMDLLEDYIKAKDKSAALACVGLLKNLCENIIVDK